MLNEWIETYAVLDELGCDLGESHPSFKLCPKSKKGFVVFLDEHGEVWDVKTPDFDMASVHRWQKDKHAPAFPVFNARALVEIPDPSPEFPEERKKVILTFVEELKAPRQPLTSIAEGDLQDLEGKCNELWAEDMTWIGRCLRETPDEIQTMLGDIPKSYGALKELILRVSRCEPEKLKERIGSVLRQKLAQTGERIYAEGLFALKKEKKKKERGREHKKDFLYLLTIGDWDKYGAYPPYHHKIQKWMALRFEKHNDRLHLPTGKSDAFGFDMSGADSEYPEANAGGLGPKPLFAANKAISCLKRYGLEGPSIFPAGYEARQKARKAMEYILNKERKGTTWESLTKYEGLNTVAFAYCTKLKDATIMPFLVGEDKLGAMNIYRSEEATRTALKMFEGVADREPGARIVIGVIAAVDKGNAKVLASRQYPLSRLLSGANLWQASCGNISKLCLPWIGNKKTGTRDAISVYPIQAIWLLNSEWRQNGKRVTLSRRFKPDEALDLLFGEDKVIGRRIDTWLGFLVEKSARALITAGLKATLGPYSSGKKLDFKDSIQLHMLPSLYGLLLHRKGINKEDYMKEDVFYLGKFFAVVDRLHIQYCKDVRNGDVPMRLLGNDHVSLALQNPLEAFVNLGRRLEHPYVSWAKRVGTETIPERTATRCLEDIAELTGKLADIQIPTDIDDAGRAKMLLGYLSYGAKGEETENKNINDSENNLQGGTKL